MTHKKETQHKAVQPLVITKATYGDLDVTEKVQSMVNDDGLSVKACDEVLSPVIPKTLVVEYTLNGEKAVKTVPENEGITIAVK